VIACSAESKVQKGPGVRPQMADPQPRLEFGDLHLRHPGVPAGLSESFREVTSVCLQRHHTSPTKWQVEVWKASDVQYLVEWTEPSDGMRRGYGNSDDATRDGAYAMALAAVEKALDLRAYSRSETRTGCDWYLARPDLIPTEFDLDVEGVVRLEVSGIDRDDREKVLARASRKLAQLAAVASALQSLTGVVGFRSGTVLFRIPTI
jgi:hypothetical protein